MKIISYLSISGLGLKLFVYFFGTSVILLLCGVYLKKRVYSKLGYYLGIISLVYFLLFNNIDAYIKLIQGNFEQPDIIGFLIITALIDFICIAVIVGIYFAIKRLKKNVWYYL